MTLDQAAHDLLQLSATPEVSEGFFVGSVNRNDEIADPSQSVQHIVIDCDHAIGSQRDTIVPFILQPSQDVGESHR